MGITMRRSKNNDRGFTLVEAAIIITVLGLILAPFFGYLAKQQTKEENVSDEKAHERITAAIATYVAEHNRYPCPAIATLAPNDPDFGLESRATGAAAVEIADCLSGGSADLISTPGVYSNAGIYFGAVPVRTLGLSLFDSVNAYGWKYMYAVTASLADADSFDPTGATTPTDPFDHTAGLVRLGVDQDGDGSIDAAEVTTGVHFVLVNPGRNGRGSFSIQGTRQNTADAQACAGGGTDTENCNNDDLFHDLSASEIGRFDDTIVSSAMRKESTFWEVDGSSSSLNNGGVDMKIRAGGNIGIGTSAPSQKVHIRGGNVKVRADSSASSDAGNMRVDNDLESDGKIKAGNSVKTTGQSGAAVYYYSN